MPNIVKNHVLQRFSHIASNQPPPFSSVSPNSSSRSWNSTDPSGMPRKEGASPATCQSVSWCVICVYASWENHMPKTHTSKYYHTLTWAPYLVLALAIDATRAPMNSLTLTVNSIVAVEWRPSMLGESDLGNSETPIPKLVSPPSHFYWCKSTYQLWGLQRAVADFGASARSVDQRTPDSVFLHRSCWVSLPLPCVGNFEMDHHPRLARPPTSEVLWRETPAITWPKSGNPNFIWGADFPGLSLPFFFPRLEPIGSCDEPNAHGYSLAAPPSNSSTAPARPMSKPHQISEARSTYPSKLYHVGFWILFWRCKDHLKKVEVITHYHMPFCQKICTNTSWMNKNRVLKYIVDEQKKCTLYIDIYMYT